MAASPEWKVYSADGQYKAACKDIEAAAVLVSWLGNGATIRHGHSVVVWTEGWVHGVDGIAAERSDIAVVASERLATFRMFHRG